MGILQLMKEEHYLHLWDVHLSSGTPQQLRFLIQSMILLLDQLVRATVYPNDWFVMRTVTNHTILTAMQEIAQPLISTFLKHGGFDYEVSTRDKINLMKYTVILRLLHLIKVHP